MTTALPSYRVRFVHLTAVWAYGVTQPVFALIDGNPDLLLHRDATRASVVLLAVLLAVVPPAVATGYAWLAGRYSPWIGDRVYLVALALCLVPIAARAVKQLDPTLALAIGVWAVLVVAGLVAYTRSQVVRLFVGYSIVLPVLSLVWFVHGLPGLTEGAEAAAVPITSPSPVVFVVLDEMAASTLMTRDGELDSVRYPNFARLAGEGTWYRNATTVHDATADAVPSILSGLIGRARGVPNLHNHPDNLFTLLGASYSLHVEENITRLCPRRECPRARRSTLGTGYGLFSDSIELLLPRILPQSLSEHIDRYVAVMDGPAYNRVDELEVLLDEFSHSKSTEALLYSHQLLPHAPWRFFPSGAGYGGGSMDVLSKEQWADNPWLVLQNFQRYLLQVGYVDAVIGRVLRTLDRASLYERSMIVVVADHGVSFRAGESRRNITRNNLADIANIPLFVKYPNQTRGTIDSRPVRSVDIVPTIADVLGVRLPWQVDGVSLLAPSPTRDIVVGAYSGDVVQASLVDMIRSRDETLQHKVDEFGEGHDSLFRIGTNKALLGRDVSRVVDRSPAVEVEVENEQTLTVRRASGFIPARISGHVVDGRLGEGVELAIAVNGHVRGLTTWFWDDEDDVQRFRSLVPPGSFREGVNRVDVFLVQRRGTNSLVSIGSTGGQS
jgi:hypothetical protein